MIVVKSSDVRAIQSPEKDPMVAKGPVSLQRLIDGNTTGGFSVSLVKFNPGTKLSYHTHPAEQILYVVEGKGILATKEKEYVVTPGTVIVISPGEVHMHGATEDSSFTHVAIYQGESKVVQ
jgi:quercetin dioxygenase-like cupin family protein